MSRPQCPPLSSDELGPSSLGAALGEAWPDRIAVGALLGVARSTPTIWYGVRGAVQRPAAGSAPFGVTEYHASAELGVQPGFAAGIRASIGVGPSVLFVKPRTNLAARSSTATSVLFFDAHLSRPFWFGRFAVMPDLGVRVFTGERGVRIDAEERLRLYGIVPVLSLGLGYRVDLR